MKRGESIGERDIEKELRVLSTLPFIVEWIQADKDVNVEDLDKFKRLFPEQFEFTRNSSFDDIIELNSRYKNSKMYGKHVEAILSEDGRRWLEKTLPKLKSHGRNFSTEDIR